MSEFRIVSTLQPKCISASITFFICEEKNQNPQRRKNTKQNKTRVLAARNNTLRSLACIHDADKLGLQGRATHKEAVDIGQLAQTHAVVALDRA